MTDRTPVHQPKTWGMLSVDLNAFRTRLGEAVMCDIKDIDGCCSLADTTVMCDIKDIDGCCSLADTTCSQPVANTQVQYK